MLLEAGFNVTAGGNLGTALSSQVPESRPDAVHVVEVSSFQLETTDTFHPWISVLLNLSPDHLDRHASFEEYARAKARIFANQTPDDWAVINADDPASLALARGVKARRFDFALDSVLVNGVGLAGGEIVRRDDGAGRAADAVVVGPSAGPTSARRRARRRGGRLRRRRAAAAMRRAVEGFRGLEHALEPVAEIDGVRFVNDSKATNIVVGPTRDRELRRRRRRDHGRPVQGRRSSRICATTSPPDRAGIVTIGEAAPLDRGGARRPRARAPRRVDAGRRGRRASTMAPERGVVLLAPACSSFDMFKDYAERGRAFKERWKTRASSNAAKASE